VCRMGEACAVRVFPFAVCFAFIFLRVISLLNDKHRAAAGKETIRRHHNALHLHAHRDSIVDDDDVISMFVVNVISEK
jgi:hypothetical protein